MPWLTRESEVLASVVPWKEASWPALEGAVTVRGPALIHSFRSASRLDVACCRRVADGLRVMRVAHLAPRRLGRPCLGVAVVAAGGAFERWRLQVGDIVEIQGP